jgi:hypothetical protein
LLGADGVVKGSPATPTAIAEVAKQFKTELPQDLVDVWSVSNGLALDPIDADLMSCEQVVQFTQEGPAGILPLFHDRQSNYLALAMNAPRAPRLLHVPHDDSPRLLFSGLESGVEALLRCLESGESLDIFLHEAEGDYAPDIRRSERDQQAARALLATDGANHEWNFAAQLLDETNLEEFARLLETDHFVRRDVRARMDAMQSPRIRELRAADRKAFAQFTENLATSAQAAGLRVEKANSDEALRIGGIFISLEAFFHERRQPNAMARTIARIQELIALKAKRA